MLANQVGHRLHPARLRVEGRDEEETLAPGSHPLLPGADSDLLQRLRLIVTQSEAVAQAQKLFRILNAPRLRTLMQ